MAPSLGGSGLHRGYSLLQLTGRLEQESGATRRSTGGGLEDRPAVAAVETAVPGRVGGGGERPVGTGADLTVRADLETPHASGG